MLRGAFADVNKLAYVGAKPGKHTFKPYRIPHDWLERITKAVQGGRILNLCEVPSREKNTSVEQWTKDFDAGKFERGIIFSHNTTDARWFHDIVDRDQVNCVMLILGRIAMLDPEGAIQKSPVRGQIMLYYGPNSDNQHLHDCFGRHVWLMH